MPHLQFDLDFAPTAEEKRRLAAAVVREFAAIMDTGTDHIAIVFRQHAKGDLVFGRAGPSPTRIAFLNFDIRNGRTPDQRRRFALAVIRELGAQWQVPPEAVYLVYSDHVGENFQMHDRVLPSWKEGEDPLAGGG